jgi:PAS domain S-box-containing protein
MFDPLNKKNMESKQGMDALFLYATEGILVASQTGEIIRANPSAEKLFGYEKDELLGKKIEVLVPQRLSGKHSDHRERFFHNPHARSMGANMELFGVKKDGSEFPVEISLSPYHDNIAVYVIAFIIDITVRKQSEENLKNYSEDLERQVKNRTLILQEAIDELEKTKKDLHNALEKEKELNELKSRFVSMASHEFRTPLTTMMSSLALVSRYGEQHDLENQTKHVSKIKASINNLTDILNEFLSLSKLEEGKIENMPEELNLKTFIADIVTEMQSLAIDGQKLAYRHSGKETVEMDRKLLKNVMINLISNAVKFSPEGGLIEVNSEVTKSSVMISVKDYGIGIPQTDQKHLFERFFRGQNAIHIQGTGLGLNIVGKYAELMKGSISFESTENEGTTFTMVIPQ